MLMKHETILIPLLKPLKLGKSRILPKRSQPIATPPNRGSLIKLGETDDIAARLIMLTKKVESYLRRDWK